MIQVGDGLWEVLGRYLLDCSVQEGKQRSEVRFQVLALSSGCFIMQSGRTWPTFQRFLLSHDGGREHL